MDQDTIAGLVDDVVQKFYPMAKVGSRQTINGVHHFFYRATQVVYYGSGYTFQDAMKEAGIPENVMVHISYPPHEIDEWGSSFM